MRILIAGCGDVGTELGVRLAADGHRVWGLRRSVEQLPPSIKPLCGDLTDPETLPDLPAKLDQVVFAAAAGRSDEAGYRAIYVDGLRLVLARLEAGDARLRRIFFTSSTGVYGQKDGEWVDETSPTKPSSFRGQVMLEAERAVLESPWPATVLRLGGIYGPGRTRLIQLAGSGAPCQKEPPLYTNRIHRDDAARALAHLMALPYPDELYLGVDDHPTAFYDVLSWLCGVLGREEPPIAAPGDSARGSKRCSNRRLLATGFRFRYPSFREGYSAILGS